MSKTNKIVCIVGPTASGKTGLGVQIAKKFNGEIISADSRQVFRGLDIGTGKEGRPQDGKKQETPLRPSLTAVRQGSAGRARNKKQINHKQFNNLTIKQLKSSLRFIDDVPQWLIDIVEPGTDFNLFDWIELAKKAIADIQKRGKLPIIVGGTGLYVQALVEGFEIQKSNLKNKNDNSKRKNYSRAELEEKSLKELQEIYYSLPSNNYSLDKKNPHRLIRAIEKAQSGERPTKSKPKFDVLQIGIKWPKDVLNLRIDKRVDQRFDDGMLEEVQTLLDQGVSYDWMQKIGLEYRVISKYLISYPKAQSGEIEILRSAQNDMANGFRQMVLELKTKIHQYAKRQMTWFKRFPEIKWIEGNNYEETEKLVDDFVHKAD